MPKLPSLVFSLVTFGACAATPNAVTVELAPDLVSSIDGTLQVHTVVLADGDPVGKGTALQLAIDYTDRNGTPHAVAPVTGATDDQGAFDTKLEGLIWDGTGTITATAGAATGDATFAILDRSPPKVTITPPAAVHVNQTATFMVHITDEIGVSEVWFEADQNGNGGGNGFRQRATVVASGSVDSTIGFDFQANDTQAGQMITFFSLASDLSSNQGAAAPVTVTIAP